jgi:hypothetical protein
MHPFIGVEAGARLHQSRSANAVVQEFAMRYFLISIGLFAGAIAVMIGLTAVMQSPIAVEARAPLWLARTIVVVALWAWGSLFVAWIRASLDRLATLEWPRLCVVPPLVCWASALTWMTYILMPFGDSEDSGGLGIILVGLTGLSLVVSSIFVLALTLAKPPAAEAA